MRNILAALGAVLVAVPAVAQQGGVMTLAEVQQRYRMMNVVHIQKCDYDRDDLFTHTEMMCVKAIYQQMYINND